MYDNLKLKKNKIVYIITATTIFKNNYNQLIVLFIFTVCYIIYNYNHF